MIADDKYPHRKPPATRNESGLAVTTDHASIDGQDSHPHFLEVWERGDRLNRDRSLDFGMRLAALLVLGDEASIDLLLHLIAIGPFPLSDSTAVLQSMMPYFKNLSVSAGLLGNLRNWPDAHSDSERSLLYKSYRLLSPTTPTERRRIYRELHESVDIKLYRALSGLIQYFRGFIAQTESEPMTALEVKPKAAPSNVSPDPNIILDAIPQIVWCMKPDGSIEYVNRCWYEFSGMSDPKDWMTAMHPDEMERISLEFQTGFQSEQEFEVQHLQRTASGTYRWMLTRARPSKTSEGVLFRWNGTCTDINDWKATSEKLKESELLFKLASRATRNVIWDYNPLTDTKSWNDAIQTEFGYEITPELLTKDWWMSHIHPDDVAGVARIVAETAESKSETMSGEYRFLVKDGTYRVVIDRATLIYNSSQELVRIIGVMEDVTPERIATANLRASEQLWRTLTNTMSQIAWMADAKGMLTWFNDRYFQFSELSLEQSLGNGWLKLVHPDHLDRLKLTIQNALATETGWDETFPMKTKTGDYRYFLSNAHPIRDDSGKLVGWLGTSTDITSQLELTDQIRQREEHLRIATEVASVGTWTFDAALKEGTWSKRTAEIHATPDIRSFTLDSLETMLHPDDRAKVRENMTAMAASALDSFSALEVRIIRPDNSIRWVSVAARRMEEHSPQHGRRVFVVGTLLDLTDRVLAQAELEKARDAAEAANAAKSAFLANMSHEIRTPLGAILGFTNLLRDDSHSQSERIGYIETIATAGHSLTRIIDDILDISKIEAGAIKLETERFSIISLVAECTALFRESAKNKSLIISSRIADSVPEFLESDAARIRQILINLIGNAVKFTKAGSVQVVVNRLDSPSIEVSAVDVQIEVIDTGIGISEENRGKIFQAFTQIDDSTTRSYGGTGLGLALSRKLATALGGDIVVDGNPKGPGCCFRLNFPAKVSLADLDSGSSPQTPAPFALEDIDLTGRHILVAEDSPEIQFLLQNILANVGAEVRVANNGQEAIDFVAKENFDLILMDIQMPLVDGYEATRRVRAMGFDRTIIAVTAHAMSEERNRILGAGCNYHLTKPLNPALLLSTIQSSLT